MDPLSMFLIHLSMTNISTFKDRNILYSSDLTNIQKMIKNLDKSYARETSKIGLLYHGAANKTTDLESSIFNNTTFSKGYTEFANKLGPVIELSEYSGFNGGLDVTDKCRIMTSATNEIVIHDHQLLCLKGKDYVKRHIGNDAILLVYDEGIVPYTPWTISGDFGDVVICIRPMNAEYMVTVYKRKNVPNFGPLDEGTSCIPKELMTDLLMNTILMGLNRINTRSWIESNKEKVFPYKNRVECIQYYREKFITESSKIEEMASNLTLSSWQ
eukprot:NODE_55_length_26219_cov_0.194908.p8 type:complete len:271 gc:universal NODE_55_length_26219_cov_0.194908:9208-8396(-)